MQNNNKIVKLRTTLNLSWPQFCVLCLKNATKTYTSNSYCTDCFVKLEKLRKWEDKLFSIAFSIGLIAAIVIFVGVIVMAILKPTRIEIGRGMYMGGGGGAVIGGIITAIIVGIIFLFSSYWIGWLALLTIRLIFRKKFSKPGVRSLKSKKPGVTILKFSNPEYAKMFCESNQTAILQ
ncbi:MAG: hypothetical protein KKC53_00995 [Actinobacteria bacterium]|nr:hypothetical protein [Actinomycetota bacterium]